MASRLSRITRINDTRWMLSVPRPCIMVGRKNIARPRQPMRAGPHWHWLTTLLFLFVATSQAQQRQLAGHTMPVRAVAYTPDGSMLITAGEDGKLLFRDRPQGEVIRAF